MRYQAIQAQAEDFPIRVLCQLSGVSTSGYYAWLRRSPSQRQLANERLVTAMHEIHRRLKGRYGSPRMYPELVFQRHSCGENRVARLMRAAGIIARRTVRFRCLTKSSSRGWAAPNLLNRQFAVKKANTVWATDISYIPTGEGHLYLAVVLDLYSRRVVGWALEDKLGSSLVSHALRWALASRRRPQGLMHHSDRDGLYTSSAYQQLLSQVHLQVSMSRKANCWDNACVESFFSSLKLELVKEESFRTKKQAQASIFEYIEVFYNRERRHSTLGYLSPVDFEKRNSNA